MRYFSLFSGIGGFELGLQGGFDCVGHSETNKYALQIYRHHFPSHRNYGDATGIVPEDLPDFDLLVAGFPCQAFSIAGRRRGFQDTRGTLFFEITRICRDKRPRYILLENVGGLLSHEDGKTFQSILGVLADIGYLLQWEILNSRNYGVPQNRQRVFIVGHLGETSRPEIFPVGESLGISDPEKQGEQGKRVGISSTIDSRYGSLRNAGETYVQENHSGLREILNTGSQSGRIYLTEGTATGLSSQGGGLGAKTGLYMLTERRTEESKACIISSPHGFNKGGKREYPNVRSSAIQNELIILNNCKIRKLTPLECERLQGFPDNWTKQGIDEEENITKMSDSQRYKCIGNAVTVSVVREIAKRFMN